MVIPVSALPEEQDLFLRRNTYLEERTEIDNDIMEIIVNKIPVCKIKFGNAYSPFSRRDVILLSIRRMMKARMKKLFPMWDDGFADVPYVMTGYKEWYDFFKISQRRDEYGNRDFYVSFDVEKWENLVNKCIEIFRQKAIAQLKALEEMEK